MTRSDRRLLNLGCAATVLWAGLLVFGAVRLALWVVLH